MTARAIAAAVSSLEAAFGERLSRHEAVREQHSHTVAGHAGQWPDAVLFARSTDEVAEAVRTCARHRCPIVPFGIGSSLEGQVNAPLGGVSIDLTQMDRVLAINAMDMDVRVQPGVTRRQLNEELRATGLFFPIDPGADASLGGMAATRASGTNAVRYGTMKDAVLAVEAVMADGRVIRTGGRARKSAAGYDLTRLLVGSEGTLGIITELTIRLHGIPEAVAGGICSFRSIGDACRAATDCLLHGIPVARIELLDDVQVRACNAYSDCSLPEQPLLLLEFHGSEASVDEQSGQFEAIAHQHGAENFAASSDPDERTRLWKVRHDAYWAARALMPSADVTITDVCVPISRLAECVEATQADIAESGITAPIVGHVGDGNFHCIALAPKHDAVLAETILEFSRRLSQRAIDMGGTCTGEHGIGQGKCDYLLAEAGDAVLTMQAIKRALDPDNILNPGKIFSPSQGGAYDGSDSSSAMTALTS
ncbi:MAG: FAD-binding protein [Gammaproteobacteria bacterium AqS3]|nr:FAD-binding protein [Gammaproteobacteria bacterium AqS3]